MSLPITYWCFIIFFYNATAPTEIYTLSLHDALPILRGGAEVILNLSASPYHAGKADERRRMISTRAADNQDRKSTRLNSSHRCISYAVFCLKKKTKTHSPLLRNFLFQHAPTHDIPML